MFNSPYIQFTLGLMGLVLCVALYLVPTIAAKGKRNAYLIFAFNIFLGWTILGWVIALIWALRESKTKGSKKISHDDISWVIAVMTIVLMMNFMRRPTWLEGSICLVLTALIFLRHFEYYFRPKGIALERPAWEIQIPTDIGKFWEYLNQLLPAGSILYFEGVYPEVIADYLGGRPAQEICQVARGTVFPKLNIFHMPMTQENLTGLAALSRQIDGPVSTHFHAYCNQKILLYWHDAFDRFPILLSNEIAEHNVIQFCLSVNLSYEKLQDLGDGTFEPIR